MTPRILTACLIASIVLAGCKTLDEPLEIGGAPPKPSPRQETAQKPSTPQRDERQNDSILALLEQRNAEVLELKKKLDALQVKHEQALGQASAARGNEEKVMKDLGRLEGLLQDALEREKNLQEKYLRVRIENVRAQQEIVRARIRSLNAGNTK